MVLLVEVCLGKSERDKVSNLTRSSADKRRTLEQPTRWIVSMTIIEHACTCNEANGRGYLP